MTITSFPEVGTAALDEWRDTVRGLIAALPPHALLHVEGSSSDDESATTIPPAPLAPPRWATGEQNVYDYDSVDKTYVSIGFDSNEFEYGSAGAWLSQDTTIRLTDAPREPEGVEREPYIAVKTLSDGSMGGPVSVMKDVVRALVQAICAAEERRPVDVALLDAMLGVAGNGGVS